MQTTIELHKPVKDDEFDIPLDISDILEICQEYNSLGFQLQGNLQNILEEGVEAVIASGKLNRKFIPFIIGFFDKLSKNAYLGDSAYQAKQLVEVLTQYLGTKHSVN
jgi:hypothetical protein